MAAFRGELAFLSNFYSCSFLWGGIIYPSSEHAFVAAKTLDLDTREFISKLATPAIAKKYGRSLKLRPDWEAQKYNLMLDILKCKFNQNPDLYEKLLVTGDTELVELNEWHDNIWGNCTCNRCGNKGQNLLGKALMYVREELKLGVI